MDGGCDMTAAFALSPIGSITVLVAFNLRPQSAGRSRQLILLDPPSAWVRSDQKTSALASKVPL
jgi:hypothetical protein